VSDKIASVIVFLRITLLNANIFYRMSFVD